MLIFNTNLYDLYYRGEKLILIVAHKESKVVCI